MSRGEPDFTLGRRPALDGLRGIAILLVRAQHAQIPHMAAAGTVGVTLFFVLSGFLITSILRREHGGNGRINYRSFYGRRARRLLPALALLLVAVVAYVVASRQPFLPVALAAGYGSNIGGAMGVDLGNLQLTWTLSLEEQFYLGWPLLLPLVVRWRPALGPCRRGCRLRCTQNGTVADRSHAGAGLPRS